MIHSLEVPAELIDHIYTFKKSGKCAIDEQLTTQVLDKVNFRQNDAFILTNGSQSVCVIIKYDFLHILKHPYPVAKNLKGENIEQSLFLDYLSDPEITMVAVTGRAGSGKTLLTVAIGYIKALSSEYKNGILIGRPPVSPSKKFQYGFVPGSLEEKMRLWMSVFYENLDKVKLLMEVSTKNQNAVKVTVSINELSLEHIKGITVDGTYIFIDEAEDLSLLELKSILTRVGHGSKIIIAGDEGQSTEKGCKNSISSLQQKIRDYNLSKDEQRQFAFIELKKSLRSKFTDTILRILG
jgi:PhoH-like ATPase